MVRVRPFPLIDHDALALEVDAVVARLRVYRNGCLDKRQFLRPIRAGRALASDTTPLTLSTISYPSGIGLDRVAFVGIPPKN